MADLKSFENVSLENCISISGGQEPWCTYSVETDTGQYWYIWYEDGTCDIEGPAIQPQGEK